LARGEAGSAFLVFEDENDALGAGAGAAAGQALFAGRHIEAFDGDIAFVIKRIEVLGNRMATGIAGALSFFDAYFHADIFLYLARGRGLGRIPLALEPEGLGAINRA
jgi:hypothetical protein